MKSEILSLETSEKLAKYNKVIDYIKNRIQVLETKYSYDKNDEYMNAKLFGGKKELENILRILEVKND